ncbi:hypothetical protein [Aestuariibaculum lutulentum]|uniref:Tubulin/FtsZ GTPase domain-containing protein n=1 Tax=Aestuariibaculum lutulentum TaxID=2920935 RepID=A0ABS9RGY4_9FLAO|nr:hypothetical protein [Aestuariibaculum lutulentum]MCH4552211.1 hypothetical protein [Aestuariibaculum lutulentum]
MAKLYVFGIGGTGSRVLKSLTMLMASGVKLQNGFDTIVPLIIDPDAANGDLNRTADILTKYQNIYKTVGENNKMFGTKILTLKQLVDENIPNISDHFKFGLTNTGQKFGDFIDFNGLDRENRALVELLFSQENLEADMTVGFKGNPNIGSIVLNRFADSPEYKEFTNSFNPGDAIFIISSIFGGTGASGFPLLLKNLRVNSPEIVNSNEICTSTIGAITYLPYFKVSNQDKEGQAIDSSTFYSKSKAALSYYQHAIFDKEESLDAFYYLGDYSNNNMPYAEGKSEQKNNAHFLELAGALSIIDFTKDIQNLGKGYDTTIKEFGIESHHGNKLKLEHLGQWSKDQISLPLSKMVLLYKFLIKSKNVLSDSKGGFNNQINQQFYKQEFYTVYFYKFLEYFNEWISEMDNNDVSFSPYHDNQDHDTLMDFIKGKEVSRGGLFKRNKSSADLIIKEADLIIKNKTYDDEGDESKFLKVLDDVLTQQLTNILN